MPPPRQVLLARRSACEPFGYVTTPNADHLVRMHRRPELRPLYQNAMLRLLDSRVVALVARLVGLPAPRVAPGSDLTALLLARHLTAGERVTIVGLSARWLPALVARCGLAPPAHLDPPRRLRTRSGGDAGSGRVRAGASGTVRVPGGGLAAAGDAGGGDPGDRRATGIGLCIGASLEFIAGARRRAPLWMQHAGLEWLHRLGAIRGGWRAVT